VKEVLQDAGVDAEKIQNLLRVTQEVPLQPEGWSQVLETLGQTLIALSKHDDQNMLLEVLALCDSSSFLRDVVHSQLLLPSVAQQVR
jgi:hypothetical protein